MFSALDPDTANLNTCRTGAPPWVEQLRDRLPLFYPNLANLAFKGKIQVEVACIMLLVPVREQQAYLCCLSKIGLIKNRVFLQRC